ncbi:hypothetical protein E2562_019795 [Oryza meyeriana var. granulata]|uniref:Uncharacterized protein n=1 Tax=Oryza meyeriana var. granulata TaxID=110450 RepID=A0A6G1DJI8_9ORYZ|nr:hypothetical protein E2562_019795 [Oryza meyeriana var. granulata]KAF0912996.1 hypothetical protein E2562_019795 [Oryza meyeriana var. granulata]KAF0912997.1 hypothetical protein E2562_019795 [Oryza meyeriana var. granulata]
MGSHQAPPPEAGEPLPPPPADQQPPADAGGGDGWPTCMGFVFVALNTAVETRRFARGATFAVVSYLHLLLFLYFYSLTRFQGAPRGSPGRGRLKPPLLALAALLAVEFAYQLMGTARLTTSTRAWEIAAATVIGAIYGFLHHTA